jgi:hypothetical protein
MPYSWWPRSGLVSWGHQIWLGMSFLPSWRLRQAPEQRDLLSPLCSQDGQVQHLSRLADLLDPSYGIRSKFTVASWWSFLNSAFMETTHSRNHSFHLLGICVLCPVGRHLFSQLGLSLFYT